MVYLYYKHLQIPFVLNKATFTGPGGRVFWTIIIQPTSYLQGMSSKIALKTEPEACFLGQCSSRVDSECYHWSEMSLAPLSHKHPATLPYARSLSSPNPVPLGSLWASVRTALHCTLHTACPFWLHNSHLQWLPLPRQTSDHPVIFFYPNCCLFPLKWPDHNFQLLTQLFSFFLTKLEWHVGKKQVTCWPYIPNIRHSVRFSKTDSWYIRMESIEWMSV